MAWAKVNRPGRAATSFTRATRTASSMPASAAVWSIPATSATTARSNSRPTTAPTARSCWASGASRPERWSTTARTPCGQAEPGEVARHGPALAVLAELARLGEVAQDLGHEERVAGRLVAQGAGQPDTVGVQLVTGRRLQQRDELGQLQTPEVDPHGIGQPMELGQHLLERMVGRELGRAVDGDDQQTRHLLGDQEAQQRQALAVGPLQVVEDQHHRHRRRPPWPSSAVTARNSKKRSVSGSLAWAGGTSATRAARRGTIRATSPPSART